VAPAGTGPAQFDFTDRTPADYSSPRSRSTPGLQHLFGTWARAGTKRAVVRLADRKMRRAETTLDADLLIER
jgi:hypothetical protein